MQAKTGKLTQKKLSLAMSGFTQLLATQIALIYCGTLAPFGRAAAVLVTKSGEGATANERAGQSVSMRALFDIIVSWVRFLGKTHPTSTCASFVRDCRALLSRTFSLSLSRSLRA